MTLDIGHHILNALIFPAAVGLATWWYGLREKRKRERNKSTSQPSQQADAATIRMQNPNKNIPALINDFFNEMELHFEQTTEKDSVECFTVGFDDEDGEIMMRVYVLTDRDLYQIIGQRKAFIPESDRDTAIKAINRYNMQSIAVGGCISDDGTVTFWISHCTDGNSFSPESFGREFGMVLAATEDITGQIMQENMKKEASSLFLK